MINAFLADDEQNNLDNIAALLLQYFPEINVAARERNSENAIQQIRNTKPDLLFLDIQMPGKSGFDILAELGFDDYAIIFVTAYDQYGIQALRVSAVDYLLKPIDITQFKQAVNNAIKKIHGKRKNENLENLITLLQNKHHLENHRIAISTTKEMRFVFVREIIFCESDNSYTFIHLQSGEKITSSQPMLHYDAVLAPYGFIRTHQSYLVNKTFVKSLIRKDGNYLLMHNEVQIPVSRYKLENVRKAVL